MADETPTPTTKAPWTSKTLWTNLIVAIAAMVPQAQTFVTSHPGLIMGGLAVANFVLRLVTKDKLALTD